MTEAHAVKADGVIDVRTVGPSPRSAKINWIWNLGVFVSNDMTDEVIEDAWNRLSRSAGAECVRVSVIETH